MEYLTYLKYWLYCWLTLKPHEIIGDDKDNPYLKRWHIIPHNRFFNVFLHQFLRDDDDRAMHDHPWASLSVLLCGKYIEVTDAGEKYYKFGSIKFRSSFYKHRIKLINNKPAITLFITGRETREWGFHCPTGWKSHDNYKAEGGC